MQYKPHYRLTVALDVSEVNSKSKVFLNAKYDAVRVSFLRILLFKSKLFPQNEIHIIHRGDVDFSDITN